jgi:short-subunit dehydrogenase
MNSTSRLTALITGAGSGIGEATAARFAKAGYNCILLGRTSRRLELVANAITNEHGGEHTILTADVSKGEDYLRALAPRISSQPPDVAIVNAGIGLYGPVSATDWSDVNGIVRTNIDGALATVHAVLPSMLRRGGGSIVLVSSVLGKRALAYNAVYSASKAALHGFADALRLEVRQSGVHVGVVCPARTDTPFFQNMTYAVPQTRRRAVPTSAPEVAAEAMYRCVQRRKREVVISAGGKLFVFAGVHFPRLMDFVLSRMVPTPEEA